MGVASEPEGGGKGGRMMNVWNMFSGITSSSSESESHHATLIIVFVNHMKQPAYFKHFDLVLSFLFLLLSLLPPSPPPSLSQISVLYRMR